jgi:transcription elongation GreA/GreB family factor
MSPLGFALIGHAVGDRVTVRDRGGRRTVTIVDVRYTSERSSDSPGGTRE